MYFDLVLIFFRGNIMLSYKKNVASEQVKIIIHFIVRVQMIID